MASRLKTERSTDAPMDFQFTNRPSTGVKPVWASSSDDPQTPRKRPHDDMIPSTPSRLGSLQAPTFGSNQNVPFIFQQTPAPQTPQAHPWAPPPHFSPSKAFPQPSFQQPINDVDMQDVSPPKLDEKKTDTGRAVALGGMRRVFNSRQKARDSRLSIARRRGEDDETESDSDEEDRNAGLLAQNTSHHYTLNMPAPAPPPSDMPYILLGYLQFFFNLSLILLFLYVVLQFILTIQRDVQQRISEYSMDIVQEIAMCALQHKNNLCASNPIPAMAQQCSNWETCMNRDPAIVGHAKVGAELIAEIVNGFVEPISWKALAFTLSSLAFLTLFINALLSLYRTRHHPIPPAAEALPAPPFAIPPSTPYPGHHFGGYLSPAPTPSWGRSRHGLGHEDHQTPTRKRRLEGGGAVKIK